MDAGDVQEEVGREGGVWERVLVGVIEGLGAAGSMYVSMCLVRYGGEDYSRKWIPKNNKELSEE